MAATAILGTRPEFAGVAWAALWCLGTTRCPASRANTGSIGPIPWQIVARVRARERSGATTSHELIAAVLCRRARAVPTGTFRRRGASSFVRCGLLAG